MRQQTTDIQVGGYRQEETTKEVILLIQNQFIPAQDHIKIHVTSEGIIIERWQEAHNRYVNSYGLLFSEHFNGPKDDVFADEPEDEDEAAPTVKAEESGPFDESEDEAA